MKSNRRRKNLPFVFTVFCTLFVQWSLPQSLCAQDDVNRPIKDKWAVIIGVSKFANPSIPSLQFPAKDAADFANFLVSNGNFSRDHILLLTNEKATKVNILDAFGDGWLPRRALKDDLVVVFISTHGSAADTAGENFIIAHDSDPEHPYATGIRLQDLSAEVKNRTGCDRLVLLLDACHSGAAVKGQKALVRTPTNFRLDTIAGKGQLIISSSDSDQSSWESKRYPNGVFTRKLIEALQIRGKATKLSDAYPHLRNSVEQEVRFDRLASQTPVMLSKWKGEQLVLCAPPAAPRKVLPELSSYNLSAQTVPPSMPIRRPVAVSSARTTSPSSSGSFTRSEQYLLSRPMMTTSWTGDSGDVTLESGTRLIYEAELGGLNHDQLECLYNEAYARHGRGFQTPHLKIWFDKQPWYQVDSDYHWPGDDPKIINQKRTPKQWENMQLIKRVMSSRA